MSQSLLNRTSYAAVATTMPIAALHRQGSIESLLQGHSKSNPAAVQILVRKNFEPFAQAHVGVTKGNNLALTSPFIRTSTARADDDLSLLFAVDETLLTNELLPIDDI